MVRRARQSVYAAFTPSPLPSEAKKARSVKSAAKAARTVAILAGRTARHDHDPSPRTRRRLLLPKTIARMNFAQCVKLVILLLMLSAGVCLPASTAASERAAQAMRRALSDALPAPAHTAAVTAVVRHKKVGESGRALSEGARRIVRGQMLRNAAKATTDRSQVSTRKTPTPPPTLHTYALQSPFDATCLLLKPMRFGPCDDDELLVVLPMGRRLVPLYADYELQASLWIGKHRPAAVPAPASSSKAKEAEAAAAVAAAAPAAANATSLTLAGETLDAGERRLCADRWCIRCLTRGNASRVRVGLCAVDGYEVVSAAPALPLGGVDIVLRHTQPSHLLAAMIASWLCVRLTWRRQGQQ